MNKLIKGQNWKLFNFKEKYQVIKNSKGENLFKEKDNIGRKFNTKYANNACQGKKKWKVAWFM